MFISRLVIHNVRNVSNFEVSLDRKINLIVGENGSGKSSILESIHLLGFGRSFRKSKNSELIQFNQDSLIVHSSARLDAVSPAENFGIAKFKNGDNQIRVKGQRASRLSELSSYFPIISFTIDSLDLIEGSPNFRRRYIDWLVFHVEHSDQCSAVYRDHARVLEQRNTALRKNKLELAKSFDPQLILLNQQIYEYRQKLIDALNSILTSEFEKIDQSRPGQMIKLVYKTGWNTAQPYSDIITQYHEQDLKRKTTMFGVHRDDISFMIDDRPVKNILSRGESKRFVMALLLCAERLIYKMTQKKCVWLFDDLCSELDLESISRIFDLAKDLDNQMFFTCIEKDLSFVKNVLDSENLYSVFHVKHGQLIR